MPKTTNCYYATPLCFYRVNRIFFGIRAFYLFFIQIFAVILHSHSALESHSRYRSTKSAGDQGLCSPQKSEIFGGPNGDASHAHRTLIVLPSHTHTRANNKWTWCFLQMQVIVLLNKTNLSTYFRIRQALHSDEEHWGLIEEPSGMIFEKNCMFGFYFWMCDASYRWVRFIPLARNDAFNNHKNKRLWKEWL